MDNLKKYIEDHKSNLEKSSDFVTYLYSLMDKYNFKSNSSLYNKANISRQLFSSIVSNKVNPSLETCLRLAFALECSNHECKYLLKKAGYTLPSSNLEALVYRYCFENKIYDLYKINKLLISVGLKNNIFK